MINSILLWIILTDVHKGVKDGPGMRVMLNYVLTALMSINKSTTTVDTESTQSQNSIKHMPEAESPKSQGCYQ